MIDFLKKMSSQNKAEIAKRVGWILVVIDCLILLFVLPYSQEIKNGWKIVLLAFFAFAMFTEILDIWKMLKNRYDYDLEVGNEVTKELKWVDDTILYLTLLEMAIGVWFVSQDFPAWYKILSCVLGALTLFSIRYFSVKDNIEKYKKESESKSEETDNGDSAGKGV